MATQETTDPLFISAVARAMSVLKTLGNASAPMAVTDLARAADLTQSTTWRICYTLQKLGYVRSNPLGQFSPGLPLLALGHAALASDSLETMATPLLRELANRFQGVTGMAVRDDDCMVYATRFEAERAMLTMNLRTGSRVPILTSAMGWAYLAGLDEDARAGLIATLKKRTPQLYEAAQPLLDKELARYAQQGFMVNVGVFHPNVGFAAVSFTHPKSGDIYCFNAGGVRSYVPVAQLRREVGPALRDVAQQLSAALGGVASAVAA